MSLAPTIEMMGGLKMPRIGLGTWMSTDESELVNALNAALEAGYRHIDTAYVYENETVIGKVLNEWISSGKLKREEVFVTTKLPIPGVHEDRVEMFMKKSLENLKLDYVDLYLIHFPIGTNYVGSSVTPPDQTVLEKSNHLAIWKKMEEQVDAGRAKSIGVSNFNANQVEKLLKSARIKPSCLQVELHVSLQQKDLVRYCQRNGLVVVAYSPLGSPGFNKFLNAIGMDAKPLPNMLQDPHIKKIAQKYNKSSGQILLRFLIEKNIVPIPKSVTPSRIAENFNVFDFSLDAGEIKEIEGLNIGEEARVCDFNFFPKLKDHPEWPFPR